MRRLDAQTYLFDFDGTLVDSMPTFVSLMLRILDEYEIDYEDDVVKIITPLGYHGTAEYFRTLGIPATVNELVHRMNEYAYDEYARNIPAKATVSETLSELKKQGASLNVLTASPHKVLDPCLKRLGLWDLFDNVWSCDDFHTTKSDPRIYQLASERIGVPVDQIVFVDDNVNAVKTAKLAGMRSYGIYDESSKDFIEEMKRTSDKYITSFDELIKE